MPTLASVLPPTRTFREIWDEAQTAGLAAGEAITPEPMTVIAEGGGQPTKEYFVADGVCGFAWVTFPGNDAFGRWAKLSAGATKNYPTGLHHWVGFFNQSMQRKEAYAQAFAEVLRRHGIRAYAESRMD